jgi:hypothetical protein
MSMFPSELATGAVTQLCLWTRIVTPVTNDITNMQLQLHMRVSGCISVTPVT